MHLFFGCERAVMRTAIIFSFASLLACGGGGGGGNSKIQLIDDQRHPTQQQSDWQAGVFKPSENFINKCEVPRTGRSPITGETYPDKKGTLKDENNFLRSWSNETYLWYNEIIDRDPANYTDTLSYFDVLKTFAITDTGAPKDKFHFTADTQSWEQASEAGITYGYGMQLAFVSTYPPRELIVVFTEPDSPAAQQNISRGTKIVEVDGVDLAYGTDVDTLNNGIAPVNIGEVHRFGILRPGSDTIEQVDLISASVTTSPVMNVKTLDTANGKVGYLTFNDHNAPSERALVDAFTQLRGESVTDLVLDLRYNGGGYLDIAGEVGYMIAGDKAQDKIFEQLQFNDKIDSVDPVTGEPFDATYFHNAGLGLSVAAGEALPTLNLSRVFVLSSADTCSASESIINGLRGVGVEVILIGDTTCGKPYGFYPQDNCGTTYFTIQFRGINAANFGDYTDGFTPSNTDDGKSRVRGCLVEDDLNHQLGDTQEAQLAAALYFRENNNCPAGSAQKQNLVQKPQRTQSQPRLVKDEIRLNGWMRPRQNQLP